MSVARAPTSRVARIVSIDKCEHLSGRGRTRRLPRDGGLDVGQHTITRVQLEIADDFPGYPGESSLDAHNIGLLTKGRRRITFLLRRCDPVVRVPSSRLSCSGFFPSFGAPGGPNPIRAPREQR